MQNRFLYFLLPGLFAFLPATPGDTSRSMPHPEFTLSHNQFAFRLLNAVLAEDTSNNNKLVSPLSLYLTLGMLCNGAAHETRDSIIQAMQASDLELSSINGLCKETLQQLPLEYDQAQFSIANALWYNRRRLTLVPDYQQLMEAFYYAPVQPLDFGSRMAVARVNDWIAQNTQGEITHIIDAMRPADAMILLNALYFKSSWSTPFEPSDTYWEDFYRDHAGDVSVRSVPYMRKKSVVSTFSDTSFTMIELPCGQGRHFSLYALLPQDQSRSIGSWMSALDPSRLNAAIGKTTPQYLDLSIPRWACSYSIGNGLAVLGLLGMGSTFSEPGQADFTNMYSSGAKKAAVSHVLHTVHIRVDEDGLVAATATGPQLKPGLTRDAPNPRVIRFDHPFAYFLVEHRHNLILMAGIVNDPVQARTQSPLLPAKPPHRSRSVFHRHRQ